MPSCCLLNRSVRKVQFGVATPQVFCNTGVDEGLATHWNGSVVCVQDLLRDFLHVNVEQSDQPCVTPIYIRRKTSPCWCSSVAGMVVEGLGDLYIIWNNI